MRTVLPLLLTSVVACATEVPTPASISEADKTAIRQAYDSLTAAGESDEHRRLGRFFTEDAVWMTQEGAPVQGRSAVEGWFTLRARQWDVQIIEIDGAGDLAYTRDSYTLNLDAPNFVPHTGKALAVWRKQGDGSWLIARYSYSCDSPCN